MKFQQKPHKKTKNKKSFIEKLREEEQKQIKERKYFILTHKF